MTDFEQCKAAAPGVEWTQKETFALARIAGAEIAVTLRPGGWRVYAGSDLIACHEPDPRAALVNALRTVSERHGAAIEKSYKGMTEALDLITELES